MPIRNHISPKKTTFLSEGSAFVSSHRIELVGYLHRDLQCAEQDHTIETEKAFFIHTGSINFEHSSDLGIFALFSPHSVLFLSHTRTIYFDSPKAFGERNSCPQPRPFRICLRVFSGDRADRKLFRITFHQCRRRLQAYILNRRPPESGSTAHPQLLTTCYSFTTPWTSSPFPRTGTCCCNTSLLSHFMPATFFPNPYFPLVLPLVFPPLPLTIFIIVRSKFGAPVLENMARARHSSTPAIDRGNKQANP